MAKMKFIKNHKYFLSLVAIIFATVLSWSLINSFSEDATSSAWDGIVAKSFTSGTGSPENPYIISDASEFAYFKELLEGEDASVYVNKNYKITNSFNYGGYDLYINNTIPFSGTIDGEYHTIDNVTISKSVFNDLNDATIKNIALKNINYILSESDGAILAYDVTGSTIDSIIVTGDVNIDATSKFGGFIYSASDTLFSNIILNYNVSSESDDVYKFVYGAKDISGENILRNNDGIANSSVVINMQIDSFDVSNDQINLISIQNLDGYGNNEYDLVIINDDFVFQRKPINENTNVGNITSNENDTNKGGIKAPTRDVVITPHDSGRDGNTLYINDLIADYNYYKGLNFTEVRSNSIPSGVSTGYYDDQYLVKVQIIYDGVDINNSNLVGAVSPINSENTNKYVYYKYYPLVRNSAGTLDTDENGNNYIHVELIDNPFSKRPYTTANSTTTEYGFNGWVCNQEDDSSAGVCNNTKFSFNKVNYTRYMDISATGGSQIIIHLNASWYKADVVTAAGDISDFNSMSMQPIYYSQNETVHHTYNAYWKQDYTKMEYTGSYNYNAGYLPVGVWYRANRNSGTYSYVSTANSVRADRYWGNTRYYVFEANTTAITGGSRYTGGTYTFVPNFNPTGSNTEVTISTYNDTYMNFVEEPGGSFSDDEIIQHQLTYLPNGSNAAGFFYEVSNPTTAMINTGEYYTSNGTKCTSASSCTTAYKLIQYEDNLNKSNGNSISTIENVNANTVDADNYYYLVTRDMNIFRYTSTTRLNVSNIQVNRPFTVTGTGINSTSVTGILNLNGNAFTAANDIVIENIKVYGPNTAGTKNISAGNDSKTSNVFYANSHNLKIGRNVTSSRNDDYLVAESVLGGTNSALSGTFKVIVESGKYYAYHSGVMSGSTSYTFNETTILGNDYDRIITSNNSKLKFLVGLDGYSGGRNTAGNDSLFASYTVFKSGLYGYNDDGTPNTDTTAGMYIGGYNGLIVNSLTGVKIEGGNITYVTGGYGYNGDEATNANYIGMTGGTVRSIYGGAGYSTTKGNRIINVTGGTVSYSILGGSDSYSSNSTTDGVVNGSTLIYVGGSAYIGGGTGAVQGVEAGSVFGAGGGNSSSTQKGTVNNSHLIINGGTISGSVYGGGNYGSTGTQSSTPASTIIDIYAGTIGNVYGASKSAGFSKSNYAQSSIIDINIMGGTIGNVYSGSDETGTVYGSVDIEITGGTITNNVYGGGKGANTSVTNDVDVTIGTSSVAGVPTVNGNVYGGSAFGVVNGATSSSNAAGDTTVTVENGIVVGSVFGGGQGNASSTPYILGDITVTINGGDVTSVFGGNDQAGTHSETNEVHLNGGTIQNVYGGGNRSSVTNTNVYLSGATVTNLYGGSNTLGNVSTTNVDITSGTVQNVYGGNNEGGTCGTTDVNVTGTATINGSIYGGGNQVATNTTTVTLVSSNGTIPNVYGGGNSASVTTSNVTQNGATVTNLFGGSNALGTVSTSNITHISGVSTNVYGGNNAGGNTLNSNVLIQGGSVTTTYGGGNQANGDASNVSVSGGSVSNVFGGGNSAGLTASTVTVTGGSVNDIYGGSNNSGIVSSTNILLNGASSAVNVIYGGGNRAQVGSTNVTVNSGTVTTIYGGGNLAQVTGNTTVDINGGLINSNVYGGGNFGVVKGNSDVTITDATILGSSYAGGNGTTATLEGNTNITIDGDTVVGTVNSVSPTSGCVFGGGNQAFTGIENNNNSTSNVNIVGGTIYGNVYGGANTSVIYGNTIVNIGKIAYTSSTLDKTDIYIKGNVFGGGEANASGSEIYDWSFISVTQGVNITIDADTYNNFQIDGSFFGGGNASSATGDSYLLIRNYGSGNNPKRNVSIQRVTYVTIDNSSILLKGAIDRANDYDKELFSVSRVIDFKIQNNTYMFFATGSNLLEKFQSLDSNGNPAVVTIDEDNNTLTRTVDNRVYMYEGKNLNIARDQQVTSYGDVLGMSFLGIFNYDNNHNVNTGIYSNIYDPGDTLDWTGTFSRGSYVLGKHLTNHNIKLNGFYSNFMNEDTLINEVNYIDPTPKDSQFYMWYIGENVIEYNVNLVASKYSTLGSMEVSFLEFSKPNTSFQILSFDSSEIANGVSLIDKNNIPRIAANLDDANNNFGLAMEASNSGWLTTGKTSFYTREPAISGTTYYEGENTTVVPTMLFYLYHSKNLSVEKNLGTVRISVMAITKLNALSNEVKRLVVNVNMSSALFQTTEYEGAMTPGDKYELFTSTSNNITTKSKFSAYYGLYGTGNLYQTGYHRVLASSYVLPVGTKITMLDLASGTPEYYYHVIDNADYSAATNEYNIDGECSYALSLFTKMGSLNSNSNYDDATMNSIYYNGTESSEELLFIVDFSDTTINENKLNNTLLIEIRDSNEESIISVLGIQHAQLTYSLYANMDSEINISATASDNPLYIGYNDIFDVLTTYQNSNISGISIVDTQYFDSKMGVRIYLTNHEGHVVSGSDLTGAYFLMDGVRYYPDISGYTHVKLADKVGNTEKWLIFNTDNANIATGDYTFNFEAFASADGIYYSSGTPDYYDIDITIINSSYGLNPEINEDTTVFSANNDKSLIFKTYHQSLLDSPNIRLAMYRREYDEVYDTDYELVDFQDYVADELVTTNNEFEYLLVNQPSNLNTFTYQMNSELITGTYRLSFRLYDGNTLIGEINRYIVIK